MPIPAAFRTGRSLLWLLLAGIVLVVAGILSETMQDRPTLTKEEQRWLDAHPVIRLTPDPRYPPIDFVDSTGQQVGLSAEYVRLLEQSLGIKFQLKIVGSRREMMQAARMKETDILSATAASPSRLSYLLFTPPYVSSSDAIIVRKSYTRTLNRDSLDGISLTIASGTPFEEELRGKFPSIQIVTTRTGAEALSEVALGKTDAALVSLPSALYFINKTGLSNLKVASDYGEGSKLCFGVRKDWPELEQILEKALSHISNTDRERIYDQWVGLQVQTPWWWRLPWPWIVLGLGLPIVLIAGVGLWNRILHREVRRKTAALTQELAVRLRTEEALRSSEEKYRWLTEHSADVVWQLDDELRYTYVSNADERIRGFCKEEVIGQSLFSFLTEEGCTYVKSLIAMNAETQTQGIGRPTRALELQFRCKDGSWKWMELNSSLTMDAAGKFIGYHGMTRDISERKIAEEARLRLEKQLIHAQRMEAIGTLSSGIAHDFNNILNIILGNLDLLERSPAEPAKLRKRIDGIKIATERGAHLVRQLLTFARKSGIERCTIEINDLIQEIVRFQQETFPKTIAIRLELKPNVPLLDADPNQLHQVLLNLSVNARDAMPSGGEFLIATDVADGDDLKSRFPLAKSHQYVEIKMKDTGVGMDETTLKQIFDPFFTTKGIGKGTGLGLPVALGIVEKHDGFMDVTSKVGSGTEFRIYLPIIEHADFFDEELNLTIDAIAGGTETILFIEDEEFIRETMVEVLEMKGYKVFTAVDGGGGVETYRNNDRAISLVLCDRGLPGIYGEEVYRRIGEINPRVRFILMTGFIEPNKKAELLNQGIRGVLHKPYKAVDLLLKVRNVLDAEAS